ncbi:MAG: SynChlorMet cassette protein ScmC [Anaerolineales bacterium]
MSPPPGQDMLTVQLTYLSMGIAREALSCGGLLVHGALAEWETCYSQSPPQTNFGQGVILAGPGGVGKTTASRRLPSPWRSLCDDTTLVVVDDQGQYWAHPWPTWSRFYNGGSGGSWDVQRAVPLRAVFFLSQSLDDQVVPLNTAEAMAMLMESVHQASMLMTRKLAEDKAHTIYREQLAAVEALVNTIPTYTLHLSLTGTFWQEIEGVMPNGASDSNPIQRQTAPKPTPLHTLKLDGSVLPVVYTGPSMYPTLRDRELVDVVPYEDRPVCPGDIVYFQPPEGNHAVIHRVIRVTPEGIRTRGDNNPIADPYLIQPADITGQVVAVRRDQRQQPVAGGRRGYLTFYGARLTRLPSRLSTRLMHGIYHGLAKTGLFHRLLPSNFRPRLVAFRTRHQKYLKLMMGERVVGQYDTRRKQWHIRRPFRLFVDESALPRPQPE